jgi:ABC-type uncharacterized transport system auxiliary subunit
MKRFFLWCAAALIPLFAACNINVMPPTEYTDPKTFDLSSPAPLDALPFVIEVESFSNECSGRYKMVFREDANRISIDEYNRWSMPPGAMITKYLAARFATPPGNQSMTDKPVFVLDGTVLTCELNKTAKQVDLMIRYFIIEPANETFRITGTEDYSIPVEDTTAEAFAEGMNKAAAKFAEQVVAVLKKDLEARQSKTVQPAAKP